MAKKIEAALYIRCTKCRKLFETCNPELLLCPVCKSIAKTPKKTESCAVMMHGC